MDHFDQNACIKQVHDTEMQMVPALNDSKLRTAPILQAFVPLPQGDPDVS